MYINLNMSKRGSGEALDYSDEYDNMYVKKGGGYGN